MSVITSYAQFMKDKTMNFRFLFVSFLFFVMLNACKNYYDDTIVWAENIKIGTDLETVKKTQPSFVEIAWDKPIEIENQAGPNQKLYQITEISGDNDVLNMSKFLVFVNGKYQHLELKK